MSVENHSKVLEAIQSQTNQEWVQEYSGRSVKTHGLLPEKIYQIINQGPRTHFFVYRTHRTTRFGRLILEFTDINSGDEAILFFNVIIFRQRGKKRGEMYPTGASGQFIPPKNGKFIKFWLDAVGHAPRRWSRVHLELNPRLKNKRFSGELRSKISGRGNKYSEIIKLKLIKDECTK